MAADLWASARAWLSEFEQRSAELTLVLNTEKASLEAMEREVKTLERERADFANRTSEAEAKKTAALGATAELRAAADRAAKDIAVLQKHLELLRTSRQDAGSQMEMDRQRYAQHLSQLHAQLEAFQVHVQAAVA